jgi:hypothetical protein
LIQQTNLPLSLVENKVFALFLDALVPAAAIPTRIEVRAEIVEFTAKFRNAVTAAAEGLHYVHLMRDAAKIAKMDWIGVALRTIRRFYAWRVIDVVDQTAQTTANSLSEVISKLNARCLVVCTVITNNARNEVKTVSHPANLVIHDFRGLVPGRNVFHVMRVLISCLPAGS